MIQYQLLRQSLLIQLLRNKESGICMDSGGFRTYIQYGSVCFLAVLHLPCIHLLTATLIHPELETTDVTI
ncbi:unnamed protein product [Ranitomeya imitator]|uniref:Uncharacterized protein n=1 Tax=Ranitomeya imitator TaxID=111125 RepID=A0ABN9LFH5_9NEOB|nr:unnamed protein product [Ranitomeya imitator]